MIAHVLMFASLLGAADPVGAINVSGVVETTTWQAAESPYRVIDTVRVAAGNLLTIEAGVDVLFDADVPFIVDGRIRAVGTESDSRSMKKTQMTTTTTTTALLTPSPLW